MAPRPAAVARRPRLDRGGRPRDGGAAVVHRPPRIGDRRAGADELGLACGRETGRRGIRLAAPLARRDRPAGRERALGRRAGARAQAGPSHRPRPRHRDAQCRVRASHLERGAHVPLLARARDDGDHVPLLPPGHAHRRAARARAHLRAAHPSRGGSHHGRDRHHPGPRGRVRPDQPRAALRGGRNGRPDRAGAADRLPRSRRAARDARRRRPLVPDLGARAHMDGGPDGDRGAAGGRAGARRAAARAHDRLRRLLPLRRAPPARPRRASRGGGAALGAPGAPDRLHRRPDRRRRLGVARDREPRLLPRLRPGDGGYGARDGRGDRDAGAGADRDLRPRALLARPAGVEAA